MSGFVQRNHFLLRRLQSLFGIIPVGAFFLVHMLLNSTAFQSPDYYQWVPDTLDKIPFIWAVEIGFILLPLFFHAGLGFMIAREGGAIAPTALRGYYESIAYRLQRVTGYILMVLILVHLWQTWWVHTSLKLSAALGEAPEEFNIVGVMHRYTETPLWLFVYAAFVVIAAYHFGNGVFNFACKWGLASSRQSQRFAMVLGLLLGGVGVILGFASLWGLRFGASAPGV